MGACTVGPYREKSVQHVDMALNRKIIKAIQYLLDFLMKSQLFFMGQWDLAES